ncbi:hypothetical protein BU24DRAFT_448374 [Aaosphaeria arxii CBS 175.79]|uniref:Single-strand DNA deaminase toxin A-like C-terminal domain-containing protein n=1 Tax=Aaosphaeria arxii CBS 175.79 TaxID=1450172 RepID=A0A6A5Y392_9PLEO|nr:uncharacterized protein BU24DRAFT_448374 [Aaosphaeria arxii CBS 175.79]KAF2020005.1 hypothetical protein BU24DRAFT_448374 [Aaosphaeria arxii CBS 175.79]
MSAMSCPKIEVLRWNASSVYVKCPYCDEEHRHGVSLPGMRTSGCQPGGQYEFIFPIDEKTGRVGYEIDKSRACFVKAGSQADQQDEVIHSSDQDERVLAGLFHYKMRISTTKPKPGPVLNLYDDSKEFKTINLPNGDSFEQKRILDAISDCVLGNLPAITQYLNTSAEANLFLHGRGHAGNTTLIRAAAEKSHEMVSLLLQHGADANATDEHGRSALMEAALWGRTGNVEALLKGNADKRLRDNEGRCAVDLAQPAPKNEEERYRRSQFAAADNVLECNRHRRSIVVLLGDSNADKQYQYTEPPSESERIKYSFKKSQSEMAITLHGPIRSYPVPRISKTAAVLDRGGQFKQISATSGWGVDALPPSPTNRPHWVEQVYHIASVVGHVLPDAPNPDWDQDRSGQYYASHAEKKLIAYFIERHVFLPQDRQPDRNLEDSIIEIEDIIAEGEDSFATWKKLFEADDRLLGDAYDAREVERLKHEIHVVEEELLRLESDDKVAAMRVQEEKRSTFLEKEKMHQHLIELSEAAPLLSLKRAVILSSNPICKDCDMFMERVNRWFHLNIEMTLCT